MKSATTGHRKRLEYATPIYNQQDAKINWFKRFSKWHKHWKQLHDVQSTGFLIKETHYNGFFRSSVY